MPTTKRPMYYDVDGNPIEDTLEWARIFESRTEDMAAESWWRKRTEIGDDGLHVSTVWLGLDHAFMGPPMIFETMVFEGPYDGYQWRYTTKAEAWDHHEEVVAALRAGEEPPDPKGNKLEASSQSPGQHGPPASSQSPADQDTADKGRAVPGSSHESDGAKHYDVAQIMWSAGTLRLEARQDVRMGRPVESTYIDVSGPHTDEECPFKAVGDTIPWPSRKPTEEAQHGDD